MHQAKIARLLLLSLSGSIYAPRTNRKTVSLYRNGAYEEGFTLGEVVTPPNILSLDENYEETATFLQTVRGRLAQGWRQLHLFRQKYRRHVLQSKQTAVSGYYDYAAIDFVSAPVALIIASEYDCWRKKRQATQRAVNIDDWNPQVKSMLDGIGFLEMVGINKTGPTFLEHDDMRILRFRSGSEADGEQVDTLLRELGVPEALDDPRIYDAIVEALVNTRHHAYPKNLIFPQPHFAGWWLTGMVDNRERRIYINVFDRGLGIPATLVNWDRYSVFERGWKKIFQSKPDPDDTTNDGTAIRVAMAVGRSSTGQAHRGKGLPSMEEALDLCQAGSITIYSRCGVYHREKGARPHTINRSAPIGGTLINWDLGF